QTPVNWMGVTWSFKKYMDYVYSAGMGGQLCKGDGRTRSDPSKQYGTGGTLTGPHLPISPSPRPRVLLPPTNFFSRFIP
ncbi:MAG: NAD(P)H-dependent oxidoreductase, partial [Okeania sp. SIO3B3]|nr:NAD(P)H-dependent oxidoreductase [Okeania sp. SIO3B3]